MEHIEPTQFDKLLSSGEKSIVMFYADWCPFCQRFKPIFEENVDQNTKSLKVYGCKLNEDENPLWDRFSINAVPTLIVFDGRKSGDNKITARRDAKMGIGLTKKDLDSIIDEV